MSTAYMDKRDSAFYAFGDSERSVLELVAGRYIGTNPPVPFAFRAFSTEGFMQNEEGMYELDLTARYADAKAGAYAYAFGLVWSDGERSIDGMLEPLGPVRLYLNEQLLYRSTVIDELKPDGRATIPLLLRKGWNALLIEAKKTAAGFGCRFGAEEAKVRILQVAAPFRERFGSAGWVCSAPSDERLYGEETGRWPDWERPETESGTQWAPRARWTAEEASLPNLERIFGKPQEQAAAYGRSAFDLPASAGRAVLAGSALGPTRIWVDGREAGSISEAGPFRFEIEAAPGERQLVVWSAGGKEGWGFRLEVSAGGRELPLQLPERVHGCDGEWLYAGPLSAKAEPNPAQTLDMSKLLEGLDGPVYWSIDAPAARVRPYYENAMLSNKWTVGGATNYGRWDYPLGVTMYGLLGTARELERPDIREYALSHIRSCTDFYEYSLWDRDEYGFPAINQQLVLIRMLDNCGSFGSAMLEAHLQTGDESYLRIADVIADFMLNKLERREDGAFYRTCEGEYSADTMWADDLYMSAPFLIRYAAATGKREALDEAARQFLLFKKYLYMADEGVMSHVYDFKYGMATRVPWGRGNGWVLFSLSELLERLPDSHPDRAALLDMFRELCEGIAKLQSGSGLWRQVLNEPEAYEEASCTAMFVYAFARGVRFGWLDRGGPYAEAARKGWRGLTEQAIDRQGNVHGVCSGSRYSFSPDYYMYDLRTVLNDNHGIGIMMLAGVEIGRLHKSLA